MPLKLEEVRLEAYPASTTIPEGWKLVMTGFKTKRLPSPMPWNWYTRWNSVRHEVFHKLAMTDTGYTIDELKSAYSSPEDTTEVDRVFELYTKSWDPRRVGWDLLTNGAEPAKYRLIWRDPRVHYAREVGLEGDLSQLPFEKPVKYLSEVPRLIEEAKAPKPAAAEKAPRAPRAAKDKPAVAEPAGDFLAKFDQVPASVPGIEGSTIKQVLDVAINNFVDTSNQSLEGDDPAITVRERLYQLIDKLGFEAGAVVDYTTRYQKAGPIKIGFYKILKDLMKRYQEFKANPATAPVAQPAAEAQPVTQ